jgi:hypothetical protein
MMETELDPKETWKATRSRILSSILLMLVFLALWPAYAGAWLDR